MSEGQRTSLSGKCLAIFLQNGLGTENLLDGHCKIRLRKNSDTSVENLGRIDGVIGKYCRTSESLYLAERLQDMSVMSITFISPRRLAEAAILTLFFGLE